MDTRQLIDTVQMNCHISDARHAGNYTLCIYLLKMREFFRWEQKLPFGNKLSTDDIGSWLTEREELWTEVENHDYHTISIDGQQLDPFESEQVNEALTQHELVYSGGLGVKNKPHFFIAELEKKTSVKQYSIYISGREFARDLTSPPAMSHDRNIYIRRESFRRMIWEHTDQWRWNKAENAMARAIRCYDFDTDLEGSLDAMTDNELDAAILHEIGEIQAGESLEGWHRMMDDISFTKAEIMARAVRDHFADTLHTLPTLIADDNHASIHFYFANLTNMRKHLFPSLMQAYHDWCEHQDIDIIASKVDTALAHWRDLSQQMLALHQQDAQTCSVKIEALVEGSQL
jgi:hypothetical protein